MNRTKFIRFLESLNYAMYNHTITAYENLVTREEFDRHLKETIAILKEHDETYKKEQEALPTFKVFVKQYENKLGNYIFRFQLGDKKWEFTYNDIFLFFGEDSDFLNNYVVVGSEETVIEPGEYYSQDCFSFPTIVIDLILGNVKDYDNVQKEIE